MVRLLCLTVALAAGFAPGLHAAGPERKRPNIAIILADDLGYSDVGCYGGEIQTPNLDALAAGGLRYTCFYNATRCCPSRASILTGLYPQQAGLADMEGNYPNAQPSHRGHLLPSDVTIATALRLAGYRTAISGKWHVGIPGPVEEGFDDFYGFQQGYAVDYFDPRMMIRLPATKPDTRHYEPGAYYSTDAITDHALDFIAEARQAEKPWFLYLSYNAGHFPLQAPRADVEKYAHVYEKGWDVIREERLARLKKLGVLPAATDLSPRSIAMNSATTKRDGFEGQANPAWASLEPARQADLARRMAVYAATVDHMDQQIGRVLADLKAHGEWENTLIIFLSDNGACAEWDPYGFDLEFNPQRTIEPGRGIGVGTPDKPSVLHTGAALEAMGGPGSYFGYGSGWANACNTPFRMYKHYVHEGGISTPLIVHWPAGIAAHGEFRGQVAHVMDLMATCLEVAGATYPKQVDGNDITPTPGVSLVPTFAGQEPSARDFLAWEHEGNRAVRQGKWKLVALAGQKWELYDMEADRVELHDLAAEQPDRVVALAKLYNNWAAKVGAAHARESNAVGR
jgi:arylsulfatase A-like enzyme